jgi:hypothetical protein
MPLAMLYILVVVGLAFKLLEEFKSVTEQALIG